MCNIIGITSWKYIITALLTLPFKYFVHFIDLSFSKEGDKTVSNRCISKLRIIHVLFVNKFSFDLSKVFKCVTLTFFNQYKK